MQSFTASPKSAPDRESDKRRTFGTRAPLIVLRPVRNGFARDVPR
jgi:hypothetical protein